MKKVFKLLLVILTGFVFVSTLKANANSTLVEMLDGAQIRTKTEQSKQGLRFTAVLNENALDKGHGFYLIYGTPSENDLEKLNSFVEDVTEINDKVVFKVPVGGYNPSNREFSVVLTDIPENAVGYLQNITVVAYVVDDGEELSNTTTRSVYQVARKMIENEDNVAFAESLISGANIVTDAEILYDFTSLEGKGTTYTETTLGALLDDGEHFKSVSELDRVYNGGDASHVGMLKLGGGSDNGSFILTLQENVLIKTVVLVANGWLASDKITINGKTQDLTLIENDRLVFVLDDETNEITIESNKRALIYNLELYGYDIVVPATQYVEVTFDYDCDGKDDEDVTIIKGNSVVVLDSPVRAGYTFLGWYLGEAEYNNEALNENTTLVAKWEEVVVDEYIEDAAIVYDLSTLEGKGTERNAAWWSDFFEHEYLDEISSADKAYDGNGSGGGIYASTAGLIKFGTSSVGGELTFKFNDDVLIKTVVLYIDGWTNSDKLVLNEQSYDLKLNTNIENPAMIVAILDDATSVVELVVQDRAFLLGIEFYGPEVSPTFYEVTFNSNGGSSVAAQTVLEGGKATRPANPILAEYEFKGWFKNLADENPYDFNTLLEDDLTLIAKWEKIIVISFDHVENFETQTKLTASYAASSFEGIDGVVFNYNKARNEGDYPIEQKGILLQDSAAYIEFIVPSGLSKLTFDYRKAFTGAADRSIDVLINDIKIKDTGKFGSGTGEQTTVYQFELEGNYFGNAVIKIKNNGGQVTIDNIKWNDLEDTREEFTVTFKNEGVVFTTKTVRDGDKVENPGIPTKEGFVFKGWLLGANAFDILTNNITEDITLDADWEEEQSGGDPEPVEQLLYSTGWEDGTNENSYTPVVREKTSNDLIWNIYQGNVISTGTPLNGSFNVMFRINATNAGPAYLEMKNNLTTDGITKIKFNAAMPNQTGTTKYLKVYYKLSTGDWVLYKTLEPGTSSTNFEVEFENIEGIVNVKVEFSYSGATTSNRDCRFDDIEIYGYPKA